MQGSAFSLEGIKKMASQIQFVSFDMIQIRDKEMKSHWYKSENIDLYYYQTHTGKLVKFHISLFGQVLEWSPRTGVRTGLLVEVEVLDTVSESVQYDMQANEATTAQAMLVLRNAVSVDAAVREELIQHVEAPQKGELLKDSSRPFSFVKSVMSWLRSKFP
jgi:hypothetical protein